MEDAFDDIMRAVFNLRMAFLKHGMEPPVSIELGSQRDSDTLRHSMPRDLILAQPRMGETRADAEWVCNIQGVELRMPAQWRLERDGKSRLVEPSDFVHYSPPKAPPQT